MRWSRSLNDGFGCLIASPAVEHRIGAAEAARNRVPRLDGELDDAIMGYADGSGCIGETYTGNHLSHLIRDGSRNRDHAREILLPHLRVSLLADTRKFREHRFGIG